MTASNSGQPFTSAGVCTAHSQARDDLIIREGASQQSAESWARFLESRGLLEQHGYAPYTRLAWGNELPPGYKVFRGLFQCCVPMRDNALGEIVGESDSRAGAVAQCWQDHYEYRAFHGRAPDWTPAGEPA